MWQLVVKLFACVCFSFKCRVLLNLRTSQPFEEVLEDLGQVLKINGAKKMYTGTGQEVSPMWNPPGSTLSLSL